MVLYHLVREGLMLFGAAIIICWLFKIMRY